MTPPVYPVAPAKGFRRGPVIIITIVMVVVGLLSWLGVALITGDDAASPKAGTSADASPLMPLPIPVVSTQVTAPTPAPTTTVATEESEAPDDEVEEEASAPLPDSPEDINLAQVCLDAHGIGRFGYKYGDAYSVVCLKTSRATHYLTRSHVQAHCDGYMGLGNAKTPNGRDWQCGDRRVKMADLCRKRFLDIPDVYPVEPPYGNKKLASRWGCSVPKIAGDLTEDDLDDHCAQQDFPRASPGDPADALSWKCWP